MANEIKAGDTIGNFRVTSVTTLHEQGETATMLTHEPTGLRWLHFTADESLIKACSKCRAIEEVVAYRKNCTQTYSPQEIGELAGRFVREASETADMLHNPARWTFVLTGPEHLTMPVQESIFATLLSAPAHPIGPATELKFAPKRQQGEEEREAIAEANSVLPEELRLHVMGTPA